MTGNCVLVHVLITSIITNLRMFYTPHVLPLVTVMQIIIVDLNQ